MNEGRKVGRKEERKEIINLDNLLPSAHLITEELKSSACEEVGEGCVDLTEGQGLHV